MIRLAFLLLLHLASSERIIQTNSGPVSGIALEGKNVDAFLGIPYAEPPVGNLRFARPVPKSPWKETLTANEKPPSCVQMKFGVTTKYLADIKMDEDCLYLNLWVPKKGNDLKPVMVFIHGGGLLIGSSSNGLYDGAKLSHHGDVIVASINYRVGSLGFFSGFIDEAAGSMGMYDQVLALQWIKDNAKHFGGDPDNILIFGESAGAFSVSFHMISPLSKNLFKRVILQSGSSINPAYSSDNKALREGSELVSMRLGCASSREELKENPKGVIECMKNLPSEKFTEVDSVFWETMVTGELYMVPRVGDEFLPESPSDLFLKGEYTDTDVLIGITRDEGTIFVLFLVGSSVNDMLGETINADTFNETVAEELIKFYMKNENSNKMVQKYLKKVEEEPSYTYLDAVNEIIGDAFITCSTMFQADFQSLKKHPVYFYRFDYRSPSSPYPEWVGVPHFDEVQFVFGNPLVEKFSEHEEELSRDVMDMWVAFAKTGDPNIPGGLKWPKYTYKDPKYFIINTKDKVDVRPDNYRCEAWREYFRSTIDEKFIEY